MSGLVAIFDREGDSVDRDIVSVALDQIDHRGTDGRAVVDDGARVQHQQAALEQKYGQRLVLDDPAEVLRPARLR